MEASERDDTQDWLLAKEAAPPLFGELVERIDEALDVAYASEAAVESIGQAATEAAEKARDALEQANRAAEHARRSADLAERASAGMVDGRPDPLSATRRSEDLSLRRFSDRADRLVARLRALQRVPLRDPKRAPVG